MKQAGQEMSVADLKDMIKAVDRNRKWKQPRGRYLPRLAIFSTCYSRSLACCHDHAFKGDRRRGKVSPVLPRLWTATGEGPGNEVALRPRLLFLTVEKKSLHLRPPESQEVINWKRHHYGVLLCHVIYPLLTKLVRSWRPFLPCFWTSFESRSISTQSHYMDTSLLLESTPLVKFTQNCILWNPSCVSFSTLSRFFMQHVSLSKW